MPVILLVAVLLRLAPHLDEPGALEHITSAQDAAEQSGLDGILLELLPGVRGADILSAIAFRESRYVSQVVSRIECSAQGCSRKASVWRSRSKPRGARGTYYCGVLQVGGRITWEQCLRLVDDIELNYQTSAEHLMAWIQDPACRKMRGKSRVVCALRGYGGGYAAIKRGRSSYPRDVLNFARKIGE